MPGAECPNVLGLRALDDTRRIAAELARAEHVVVIGGGFIGHEFAAVAAKQGKRVTVLEAAHRPMALVVAPLVSAHYSDLRRGHGVAVELGAQVLELVAEGVRATAARAADGDLDSRLSGRAR